VRIWIISGLAVFCQHGCLRASRFTRCASGA